jgi:hypothetical protein
MRGGEQHASRVSAHRLGAQLIYFGPPTVSVGG